MLCCCALLPRHSEQGLPAHCHAQESWLQFIPEFSTVGRLWRLRPLNNLGRLSQAPGRKSSQKSATKYLGLLLIKATFVWEWTLGQKAKRGGKHTHMLIVESTHEKVVGTVHLVTNENFFLAKSSAPRTMLFVNPAPCQLLRTLKHPDKHPTCSGSL